MKQQSVTSSYKGTLAVSKIIRMTDLEWIGVASKAFAYCSHLLRIIRKGKEQLAKQEEEITSLKTKVKGQKTFIADLTGKDGSYDTVH